MRSSNAVRPWCSWTVALSGSLLWLASMAAGAGELSLKYLGAAGWDMRADGVVVLVDPYLSRVPYGRAPAQPGPRSR